MSQEVLEFVADVVLTQRQEDEEDDALARQDQQVATGSVSAQRQGIRPEIGARFSQATLLAGSVPNPWVCVCVCVCVCVWISMSKSSFKDK